jgi:hypothetical protein
MTKYIALFENTSNKLNKWALESLSTEELSQFQAAFAANNNLWQSYQDQGLYTVEDIYETVYSAELNINVSICVGQEITTIPEIDFHKLEQDSDYRNWVNRFTEETGVIPGVVLSQTTD